MQRILDVPTLNPSGGKLERKLRTRWATILGTGGCVPGWLVDNAYFANELRLDTTPQWIAERIGIRERRWSVDESSTGLALGAAQSALQEARLDANEIDLVIVATSTPDFTMPSTACLLQSSLGIADAVAFDLVNACSGFVYALDAATRYLQSGDIHNALVVGVDRGSRLVDRRDRNTSVFFGDGAGAFVLSSNGPGRVLASTLHSRGASEPLSVPVGGTMAMDGRAIWDFATEAIVTTVWQLCGASGVHIDEIKLLVPHQANRNILVTAATNLAMPLERVVINIDRYGNTLAASVPLALGEALADGRARPGDVVALVGFGAGLAWGGMLLEL